MAATALSPEHTSHDKENAHYDFWRIGNRTIRAICRIAVPASESIDDDWVEDALDEVAFLCEVGKEALYTARPKLPLPEADSMLDDFICQLHAIRRLSLDLGDKGDVGRGSDEAEWLKGSICRLANDLRARWDDPSAAETWMRRARGLENTDASHIVA